MERGSGAAVQPGGAFVGRDEELAELRRASRSGGVAVVVTGPAGIGKSRLVRELGGHVVRAGGLTLLGRATETASSQSLRPVTEALLHLARSGIAPDPSMPYAATLGTLVPDWAPPGQDRSAHVPLLVIAEGVLRLLDQVGQDRPTLLVLEDLHWADPESLDFVEYLCDHVDGSPVTVVCTVRDGHPGPTEDLVRVLVQRGAARSIALAPLDGDRVIDLADARLAGVEMPGEVVDALRSRSEGIPLFVEELVATALASGWETVAASVPGSVVASVASRLEMLDDDARRFLLAAAAIGRRFDWRLAASAVGLADDRAAEVLVAASNSQILVVADDGYQFRHALTRDAVRSSGSPATWTLAVKDVLRTLETRGIETADEALLGADLAVQSGDPRRAAALLLRSARHAFADGLLPAADRLATRARDLDEAGATDADDLLLEVCVASGDTVRGRALGQRLLRTPGGDERVAERLLRVAAIDLASGDWVAATSHAERATVVAPDDIAVRARAEALLAHAAMGDDDVDRAVAHAQHALRGASDAALPTVQCEALEVIGRVERGRDLEVAEAAFQRAHDVALASGAALWRVRALQELGTIDLFESLRLDRLHLAREEALRIGAIATAAMVDLQLAAAHNERGEFDRALAVARRCEEQSARFALSSEAMAVTIQAMIHARTGDRAAMQAALDRSAELQKDTDYVEAAVWGQVHAIHHLVTGDLHASAEALDRAMAVIRRRPAAVLPYPGLWALVRTVIDESGDEARREVAALAFDTPVSRRALAAAEAVHLGRTGDHDRAVEHFERADAPNEGAPFTLRRALVRLLVAPAAHTAGWGEPERWLRESLARCEELGLSMLAGRARRALRDIGAKVPRRSAVTSVEVPADLAGMGVTGREFEVLVLVAAGATNREIAERLVISSRTVDKHVENLLQKTGVTRRDLRSLVPDVEPLTT